MEKVKKTAFKGKQFKRMPYMIPNFHANLLAFSNFKSYICEQKAALSEEYLGKVKSLKSKFNLFNPQKYKTRKQLKEIEHALSLIPEKVHNPLSVEDLLQDSVIETTFPSIQRLLKIYVLIPMSEDIAERGFSKIGKIVTKKHTALDDNSLEILMRISYNKTLLNTNDVKGVLDK